MQPFMKNVSVEYAEKAAPGGEIDTGITMLQDAIDGKIGFDGELVIDITDGYKPTLTADNLEYLYENYKKGGIFKLRSSGYYYGILSYNSIQKNDNEYSLSSGMWVYGEQYKRFASLPVAAPIVLYDLPNATGSIIRKRNIGFGTSYPEANFSYLFYGQSPITYPRGTVLTKLQWGDIYNNSNRILDGYNSGLSLAYLKVTYSEGGTVKKIDLVNYHIDSQTSSVIKTLFDDDNNINIPVFSDTIEVI